ncbi:hypothetical protein CROQUDRAFT_376461 [Cronartium quercuum f. sp. fusiforme G11]|uniref:Uncharacterized protein n=1 Tax=Cronartium quercuum f. sp. fusiforme G11 TaxID=708437 RepID=A0A9P6TFK4_9BASI|nr:hypothetical protein CROQUDRAFT_376461 [Cronartium quercuum f. sp. fusiforme G11]
MRLWGPSAYLVLSLFSIVSHSMDVPIRAQSCSSIRQRREWRTLDRQTQEAFLTAFKCLGTKPSSILGANTTVALRLFDDFNYVHSSLLDQIHFTAVFLACEFPAEVRPEFFKLTDKVKNDEVFFYDF